MTKSSSTKIITVLAVFAGFIASSCTSMVTEEQLIMLRDLRTRQTNLQSELERVKSDTRALESELARAKSASDECDRKRKNLEAKLQDWPNVWPDYNPNESK